MSGSDRECLLALHHAPEVTDAVACTLLARYGNAAAVCAASHAELRAAGVGAEAASFLHAPGGEAYERDLRWSQGAGRALLSWGDACYPRQLIDIQRPPALLFVMGSVALLGEPQIAVVGSRRPTPGGLRNARHFADAIARSGLVVVSGLATGIDAAAHAAALDAYAPTVAVIGTGPDVVYPVRNKALAHRIVDHGAVVSEFSCGTPPFAGNFPRRNRLMSGLSLGVLVVEAGDRSGTLVTARLAGEQGREVFVVPGSIRNPVARGCHRLIQQGAKLVQSIEDILIELSAVVDLDLRETGASATSRGTDLPDRPSCDIAGVEQCRLLEYMEYDEPFSANALVERSGFTVAEVSAMLSMMELEGRVVSEGHLYTRVK